MANVQGLTKSPKSGPAVVNKLIADILNTIVATGGLPKR